MPTKRRRRPPRRINEPVPAWAARLLEGERPEPGSEAEAEFFGWFYFLDPTPSLPPAQSEEGRRLIAGLRA